MKSISAPLALTMGDASGVGPEWPEENIFLEELLAKFGPRINNKHAQIKLLEQLMAYLMDRYPDDWRGRN